MLLLMQKMSLTPLPKDLDNIVKEYLFSLLLWEDPVETWQIVYENIELKRLEVIAKEICVSPEFKQKIYTTGGRSNIYLLGISLLIYLLSNTINPDILKEYSYRDFVGYSGNISEKAKEFKR